MSGLSERDECDKWLTKAREKEKRCDWVNATKDYHKLMRAYLASKNFIQAGEMQEQVGLCLFRAAFQAETLNKFHRLIKASAGAFQRGVEIFGKTGHRERKARVNGCKAKAVYVKSRIERIAPNKRRLLHRCCELTKKASDAYKHIGDHHGFARVCNDMIAYLDARAAVIPFVNGKVVKQDVSIVVGEVVVIKCVVGRL